MPDNQRDDTGILRWLIARETRFHRDYIGKVLRNDDVQNKGRVLVEIPELSWDGEDRGTWCLPRQLHALSVPAVNEWVEVHFVAGELSRAVYTGIPAEIQEQIPASYDGNPETHVIFEDPNNSMRVVYDGTNLTVETDSGNIELNGNAESLVLFSALSSVLSSFKTALDAHVHTGVTTGPGSSGPPPGPIGSLDISSAEAAKVKSAP